MRKTLAVLILPVLLLASAGAAWAEKRIALIIGNSAYETISALDNPKNDADLMREALEDVGFEVIVAKDASFSDMRRAIRKFGRKLRSSGKDAVGLFYYAGHGVQSQGANYLIPIGAQIESDADLSIEALSAGQILRQMEDAGNTLNLVILDACRNNPFKGKVRSATRGLSRINAASGTLVAFSAGPGQVALDGTARNSPYTAALAKHIRTPNLAVEEVFKRVRVEVEDGTSGKQTPWEESSLRGSFYFAGRSVTVTEKPKTEPEADPQPEPSDSAFDLTFWQSIQNSTSAESYEAYLKAYPEGRFSPLAKIRIRQIKSKQQAAVTTVPTKNVTEPATQKAPYHRCDRLAASPEDTQRHNGVEGVAFAVLENNAQAAVEACRAAVSTYPGVVRFEFQLGRAFNAEKSYEEAIEWYRRAVERDYPAAMAGLGNLHARGQGVARDYTEAVRWFRKAADRGNAIAMTNIGHMYARGDGVARDYTEAVRWYRKAADRGIVSAMINLGVMYKQGHGVARDDSEALSWYRKAADKDHASAMFNLGGLYYERKDYVQAANWFRKAADKGSAPAMANLGYMFGHGQGVALDDAEAIRWYRRAAEKGDTRAMYNLGHRYSNGKGVTPDKAEALRWYQKAAELGDLESMGVLGELYSGADPAKAAHWQRRASDAGDARSMYLLGIRYAEGTGVVRDPAEAARLIAEAVKSRYTTAIQQMTDHSKDWDPAFRTEFQRILKAEGVYQGAIDGSFGPATLAAIRKLAGK